MSMNLRGKYDTSNVAWDQPKDEVLGVLAMVYLEAHGISPPAELDEAAVATAWRWANRRYDIENAP